MINADLFLPYRRGTGSLYNLDHYQRVASRLNEDGVFVQWLPLYQVTDFEFGVIVNTMLQVFDEVSLWRGNFMPGQEQVALVARNHASPIPVPPPVNSAEMKGAVQGLDWTTTSPGMVRVEKETMPFFYAGNLSAARELFQEYPLNTDNHPVIEFQTPWRFREVARKEQVIWCVGPKFLNWVERILESAPLGEDPAFHGHSKRSLDLVMSGMAFQSAMVAKAMGDPAEAGFSWQSFKDRWNAAADPPTP
jgi:spermidine synthase